jgi:hypothetical protein
MQNGTIRVDRQGTKRFDMARDVKFVPDERLDAAENAFLSRQLKHMIPGVFMREYAKINARTIFPVYFANDPGADEIGYEYVEEYGEAEIVTDYGTDAPLAETRTTEHFVKVRSIWAAAQWSIQEIRAASKAGTNLSERKAGAARDIMIRKENQLAFNGDARFGIIGLFTQAAGTAPASIPRDTAGGTIAAQTAAENLDMLHALANDTADATNDIESPDTLALPPAQYDVVSTQKLGTLGQSPTVLSDFLEHSPHIRQVLRVRELAGAGSGGEDVAMVYERNIQKVRLNVALDLEQMPPERKGMAVKVTYHMRSGGLTVTRPLSIRLLEGV